jgi:type IV secretory pathway component VirB8
MTQEEIEFKLRQERFDDINENTMQFLNDKQYAAEKQNKTLLIIAGSLSLVILIVVGIVASKRK